ncbi:MAG: hypothetical protein ACP5SQ_11135 [Candidatus Saccharicenans sp.]
MAKSHCSKPGHMKRLVLSYKRLVTNKLMLFLFFSGNLLVGLSVLGISNLSSAPD